MKISEAIKRETPFRNVYHETSVNLVFTGRWIFNLHNELFKTFGITVQQYTILRILKEQYPKPTTVKLIRERMHDKNADATGVVENLRKKEFITRELNVDNRRQVDVILTQKGIDLLNLIEESGSNTMDNFLSQLNPEEAEQLNTLLNKL